MNTDVLIVGGGLAAIKACFECGRSGQRTTLIVQERLCSGSSFYPLTPGLGCLAPRHDDPDDAGLFMDEINEASQGMNDPQLGQIYIDEIGDRVAELPDMGIDVALQHKNRIACFAKRERALYVWRDWVKTRQRVRAALSSMPNVLILEQTAVLDLLNSDGQITGAVVTTGNTNIIETIQAGAVILATGGFGHLYKHSLNTADVDGSGHVMAYQAGAQLTNLEFIQFIPAFLRPRYKVLFGELCLPDCNGLFSTEGREILSQWLPADYTAQKVFALRGRHGPFTVSDQSQYFDLAMMHEIQKTGRDDAVEIRFNPDILARPEHANSGYLAWMKDKMKIDILKDRLSIAPFAQASNGGIVTDANGWTGVPGLFAAGEVAGSMHGADRIGGLAAGNCLVFGRRAAISAIQWARKQQKKVMQVPDNRRVQEPWLADDTQPSLNPETVHSTIQSTLWDQASIIRSEAGLKQARETLRTLRGEYHTGTCLKQGFHWIETVRAAQSLVLADLLLQAMLSRTESRGAHYRSDFPNLDPRQQQRQMHSLLAMNEQQADSDTSPLFARSKHPKTNG